MLVVLLSEAGKDYNGAVRGIPGCSEAAEDEGSPLQVFLFQVYSSQGTLGDNIALAIVVNFAIKGKFLILIICL